MSDRISTLCLVWLEAFALTIETGSRSEAGRTLGCTQPMIGRYLRQLEEWYGRPIFRSEREFKLTPEGQRLLHVGNNVIRLLHGVLSVDTEKQVPDCLEEGVVDAEFLEVDDEEPYEASPLYTHNVAARLSELETMLSEVIASISKSPISNSNYHQKGEHRQRMSGKGAKKSKG